MELWYDLSGILAYRIKDEFVDYTIIIGLEKAIPEIKEYMQHIENVNTECQEIIVNLNQSLSEHVNPLL